MKSKAIKPIYALLLAVSLALSFQTVANPITRQQAQQNALVFMQDRGKSISMSSLRHAPMRSAQPDELRPYYVFNIGDNQGYVIASGDDCAYAVLGYSDEGSIDLNNLPCNLQAWLDGYAQQIQYLQEHGVTASRAPRETDNRPAIAPMLTCQWNQYSPYNMYCPIDPVIGRQCVTGCVATAMAQVMYYYRDRSVNQTTYEIPAYTTKTRGINIDAIPAGSMIDWDNMIDSYNSGNYPTETQKQAVGNLMKYCGTAVEMDYSSNGSGSTNYRAMRALQRYFNYSIKARFIRRSGYITSSEETPFYSDEEWEEIIYNELANSRPVLYDGYDQVTLSGHAFVCDGYDGNGYYHMNWGWGGLHDGYYLLSAFDSEDGGLSGYVSQQDVVIYAEPRASLPDPDAGIHFVDPETKFLCVIHWDEDDDGALSLEEAAAVSDLGYALSQSAITSFDEFKYFKNVTTIGRNSFLGCEGLTSFSVPDFVTAIGEQAFDCSGLTSISIPNSVKSIGFAAFSSSRLTSVIIPNSVTSFGPQVFDDCIYLTTVCIGDSVTTLGDHMFGNCKSLASITIGKSVSSIGNYAFYGCDNLTDLTWNAKNCPSFRCPASVKRLTFGSDVDNIPESFASGCSNLTNVTIPSSVISIGKNAFKNTGLTSVRIPNSVTNIGLSAFSECSNLISIIISNSVSRISSGVFAGCSNLENVSIPNSVTVIENSAFYKCMKLSHITVPSTVTNIGSQAFMDCTGLKYVTSLSLVPPKLDKYGFRNSDNTATLRVPIEALEVYKSTYPWNRFSNFVGIDPSLGDVNLDGEVNIADINAIVNSIVSGGSDCLDDYMSDVNRDGEVNIADINTLIDIILNNQ